MKDKKLATIISEDCRKMLDDLTARTGMSIRAVIEKGIELVARENERKDAGKIVCIVPNVDLDQTSVCPECLSTMTRAYQGAAMRVFSDGRSDVICEFCYRAQKGD